MHVWTVFAKLYFVRPNVFITTDFSFGSLKNENCLIT